MPHDYQTILQGWPDMPRRVADTMIEKYGPPDEATDSMLVWHNNGSWKHTIVFRDEVRHNFPGPHTDVLEQFINYRVPTTKFNALARFDGSVIAERTKGELSARCDNEGANFLALNLAHEIAIGEKTVSEARRFYAKTIREHTEGGTPDYMQRLRFTPPMSGTADPDKQVKKR